MKNEDKPKVWVTVTRKINTDVRYESAEFQIGLSKTYNEKDDPVKLLSDITDDVQKLLDKKVKKAKKQFKKGLS